MSFANNIDLHCLLIGKVDGNCISGDHMDQFGENLERNTILKCVSLHTKTLCAGIIF